MTASTTRVVTVVGTRPEAIKMAPVIMELTKAADFESLVVGTGQHSEMMRLALEQFGIVADVDLDLMRPNQPLADLLGGTIKALARSFDELEPDIVLVQGDTTTTLAGALAAFGARIPIGHVEAGLRTLDLGAPFPEEANRSLVSRIAAWHFAPTARAVRNLESENVPGEILLTGNTIVDAVNITMASAPEPQERTRQLVLITGHRRENVGERFDAICDGISTIARRRPDVDFVFPVHPNPRVGDKARHALSSIPNVSLMEPVQHTELLTLMRAASLVITDSGGMQEEASVFGVPILVTRDKTERPEVIECGIASLVGADSGKLVFEAERLLDDRTARSRIANIANPYGTGDSAARIVAGLRLSLA